MPRIVIYDADREGWLNCERPLEIVEARHVADVVPALQEVETCVQERGLFAAGFISYEAAPAFDAALTTHQPDPVCPLLWFALFERPASVSLSSSVPSDVPILWQPNVSRDEYRTAIERIKHYIAEGDTYQVNFSFRLTAAFHDDPFALFRRLVAAQPSRHAAFIETDDIAVCSASPELFFSLHDQNIVTRPMKGTAPRGLTFAQDEQQAASLRASEKNRAENVMIVDMMRNDLGRIAAVGSVAVPSLFDVERYPTVWQMTSTVAARTEASVTDIMRALFPCASVTGAPKARTMEIIAELESTPRRVYTGAIGFIGPNRRAQFNVAIRTVLIDRHRRTAEYGVGGGVVWASTPDGEYEECLTKARILTEARPEFELLETMLFTQHDGFFLLEEHLKRLRESAAFFNYPVDEEELARMLTRLQSDVRAFADDVRIRVVLHRDGRPSFVMRPLDTSSPEALRVRVAAAPVNSSNQYLYHKTTYRKAYEDALASVPECDDVILWNERGEITESTVANIVVELDGTLYTPPVSSGLLAGTFRELLLKDGRISERVITLEELRKASQLFLINSVRKWRKAVLL